MQAKFAEGVGNVAVDGAVADGEFVGDLAVGEATRDEFGDLTLATGEGGGVDGGCPTRLPGGAGGRGIDHLGLGYRFVERHRPPGGPEGGAGALGEALPDGLELLVNPGFFRVGEWDAGLL